MREMQPRQTFFVPAVQPQHQAKGLRLNGGNDEPFYFSLGSRSTVPYVELRGGMYSNKLLSWGEVVMVRPGEMVEVWNASYHLGDIAINTGRDYCEMPTRVTVPVPISIVPLGESDSAYCAAFEVDCRRAKRAYATVAIETDVDTGIIIGGRWKESSYTTSGGTAQVQPFIIGGPVNYIESVAVPALTKFGTFPLGKRPANNIIPMTLGDTAQFAMILNPGIIIPPSPDDLSLDYNVAYYTLEY